MNYSSERESTLDVLRGIAILGIALLNVFSFAIPSLYSFDLHWHDGVISELDKQLFYLQQLLFQGRFRTILTLLFGVGLWLVYQKHLRTIAEQGVSTLYKRYLGLALFGLLHLGLFWSGDITFWYALSAFMLMQTGWLSLTVQQQWRLGLLLVLITILLNYGFYWLQLSAEPSVDGKLTSEEIAYYQQLQQGSWLELWQLLLGENLIALVSFVVGLAWLNLGTMLIGIALYRQGFFNHGMTKRQALCLLTVSLALDGTDLWLSADITAMTGLVSNFWYDFTALAMALVLCSWLIQWRMPAKLQQLFQQCGQMALSLYFLQTLLFLLWFRVLQPSWYANAERWQLGLLALAVMAISMVFCKGWLHFFKVGPLEWCWRAFYQARSE